MKYSCSLYILCVLLTLLCSFPSRSTYYILIFVHPFVRYRSLLLLRPHPLLPASLVSLRCVLSFNVCCPLV